MEIKRHFASFAEAIREGAKLRPQATGFLLTHDGRSCSYGAGAEALGLHIPPANESQLSVYGAVERVFPYLASNRTHCPRCGWGKEGGGETLTNIVWHMNDAHKLTREAVADWLYTVEESLGFTTLLETEASNELSLETQNVEQHGQASSLKSESVEFSLRGMNL